MAGKPALAPHTPHAHTLLIRSIFLFLFYPCGFASFARVMYILSGSTYSLRLGTNCSLTYCPTLTLDCPRCYRCPCMPAPVHASAQMHGCSSHVHAPYISMLAVRACELCVAAAGCTQRVYRVRVRRVGGGGHARIRTLHPPTYPIRASNQHTDNV